MYNKEIKERYIKEKTAAVTIDKYYLNNLFKMTSQFEEELNKDVCNFTTSEIENMYKTNDYYSYSTIIVTNTELSQYTNWCLNQGLLIDSQNHFLEFDRTRMSGLINKSVRDARIISRDTILKWCEELPNPSDSFLLLALFEGIRGKTYSELFALEGKDINVKDGTIFIAGRNKYVGFSKKLCYLGVDSANEIEYVGLTDAGETKRTTKLVNSDLVIKEFPNWSETVSNPVRGKRISMRIMRIFDYLGVAEWMKLQAVVDSGVIDMITRESEKRGISRIEYCENYLDEVGEQYNKVMVKSVFLHKYGDYLE